MGSKGGSSSPPAITPAPQQDNSQEMAMLMGFMEQMAGMQQMQMTQNYDLQSQLSMPELPDMSSIPTVAEPIEIDWTEKQSELANKASADFSLNQARRKGASDTVLSSPLLDEEDALVSGSILTDSKS